jgi:Cd(II)/Pb(II)-responsive transcriptional regulator
LRDWQTRPSLRFKEKTIRIKALSDATGVEIETIRFYEKQGLLPAPAREANGYREYAPAHLERLAFVRHCRALDMPLADIGRLLALVNAPSADCRDVDDLVGAQLARVRARLKSMRALEKQLVRLRAQCNGKHGAQNCGILHELVAAAHGEACACHAGAQAQ